MRDRYDEIVRRRISSWLGVAPESLDPDQVFSSLDIDPEDTDDLVGEMAHELNITMAEQSDCLLDATWREGVSPVTWASLRWLAAFWEPAKAGFVRRTVPAHDFTITSLAACLRAGRYVDCGLRVPASRAVAGRVEALVTPAIIIIAGIALYLASGGCTGRCGASQGVDNTGCFWRHTGPLAALIICWLLWRAIPGVLAIRADARRRDHP